MANKIAPLSAAMEDYLKAIYLVRGSAAAATTMVLAATLGVSAASVTNMIKKLAVLKLVRHAPYHGVELTPAGEKIALEIVRHHRLLEAFLHDALGLPWDEVHGEAHKLEHVLSDNLEDHIAEYLGEPSVDPHGDPIPTKAGVVVTSAQHTLAELAPGARAVIVRVGAQDPAHLRYLRELGLVPQARLVVLACAPFGGPVRVRVRTRQVALDEPLARQIWVNVARKK